MVDTRLEDVKIVVSGKHAFETAFNVAAIFGKKVMNLPFNSEIYGWIMSRISVRMMVGPRCEYLN